MRYASKKEEKMGILPVMNPLFNLREICKQSALLEDHLNNPRKRCPDCIRKHFLTIEALYEEAISLDKKFEYDQYLDGKAQMMRDLQGDWLDAKDTKKYHSACETISQSLRKVRKEYAPICFDVRKMASLAKYYICPHMKVSSYSDYSDYEEHMDQLLADFNRGRDTLYVDMEFEVGDYFGPLQGAELPTYVPSYIKGLHLLAEGQMPRRYESSLMDAEFFYKSDYIPMVKAIIRGLKEEIEEVKEEYPKSNVIYGLSSMLEEFEDQLKLLKSSRKATLSQVEKEERETERLVRQKPKKKPPAKHKMRKRMKVEDPDLENLGGGAGGDRDLSMNHKRVASSKKVAIAFLVEASAERKVQRNKAKKKDKDQKKSERKQRDKEVRERLESDDKPYIMSEAGNKVTFSTAINADKKNRERKEAEKILRKQRAKANEKANKKEKNESDDSKESSNPFEGIEVDGKADKIEEEPPAFEYPPEFEEAQQNLEQERIKKQQQEKQTDDNEIRQGLADSLINDPRNFYGLLQNGTDEYPRDVFLHAFAEQTMHKDFTNLKGMSLSPVEEIDTSRMDGDIAYWEDIAKKDSNEYIQAHLEGLKQTKKEYVQEKTNETMKKRIEEIKAWVDSNNIDDVFPNTSKVELGAKGKTDAVDLIDGDTQSARDELKKNDGLRSLSEVRNIVKKEEPLDDTESQKYEKRVQAFTDKMKDLLPSNPSKATSKAIREVINLAGSLPTEKVQELEDGYKQAAKQFKELFSSDKDTSELLKETAELADKLFNDKPLYDLDGEELGQAMAAAVMENMFVNNFDYGLSEDSSFVVSYKDKSGRTISEERPRAYENQLFDVVTRFEGDSDGQANRRSEAYNTYSSKLEGVRKQIQEKGMTSALKSQLAKYTAALDGAYVSMLVEGDKNLPEGRSKVDPFFLEHAKQTKNPDAMAIVASLSKENKGMDSEEVRTLKKNYLSSLTDEDFSNALGGSSGPFGDLLEVLDSQYCPDLPLNGESAGKKVPVEDCPLPIPPEAKKILRDHLTSVSMDRYSIVAQDEKGGFDTGRKEKEEESPFRVWLKDNKKKYVDALTRKDERALSDLFAMMREAQIKDLDLSQFIEGYDESGVVPNKLNQYRAKKIQEIINNKGSDLQGMLEELDSAINEKNRINKSASLNKSTYFPRRLVGNLKNSSIKNILFKIASNRPFISSCLSSSPIGETIMERKATSYVDYQQRAFSFERGMRVYPFFGGKPDKAGVVIQTFPAIGMVDVQFPHGVSRYPVEDLVLDTSGDYENVVHQNDSLTMGVYPVSPGPSAKKVASRYLGRKKGN